MTPPRSLLLFFALATQAAGDMSADSPVTFPERGAIPSKFPPDLKHVVFDPGEPDYYLVASPPRSLEQVQAIQAAMPDGKFAAPANDWKNLGRTREKLTSGGHLKILAIGDSIVNDTMRSGWINLLRQAYPDAKIRATTYVRGRGGCQHYKENDRVKNNVVPQQPDLVLIGGISQKSIADIATVIDQIRADLPETEFLLTTGTFGNTDPRDPAALAAATYSGTSPYGRDLKNLATEKNAAYLDMTTPWAEYIRSSNLHPHHFYRDPVHANAAGEQILVWCQTSSLDKCASHFSRVLGVMSERLGSRERRTTTKSGKRAAFATTNDQREHSPIPINTPFNYLKDLADTTLAKILIAFFQPR